MPPVVYEPGFLPGMFGAVAFLEIGALCLIWPRAVQKLAVRIYRDRYSKSAIGRCLVKSMNSNTYLLQLRLIGLGCLATGVALVLGFVFYPVLSGR